MLLLDRQNDVTSLARAGTSHIQLRMRADGQLLELPLGKTTIGSSPRCNVRIEQAGVQPLHCIIVHSAEGLRVRSWAANAKLNGAPFVEAGLSVGDCFTVGPVELEVVDIEATAAALDKAANFAVTADESVGIRAGRDAARDRSRKLVRALRRERTLLGELQKQFTDLQEAVLQGIEEGNSIARGVERASEELASAQQKLAESEAGARERNQLAKQNEVLTAEVARLRDEICGVVRERDQDAEEHHKLAFECAALREQHQSLSVENFQRQNEDGSRAEQLEARLAKVTEENSCLAAEKALLAQERAELQSEISRLATFERDMNVAIAAKNSTAEELHRALLQVAELQEWETRAQQRLTNHQAITLEHDQLVGEVAELKNLLDAQSEERQRIESAWLVLTAEAASLSESRELLVEENTTLRATLADVQQQLAKVGETQLNGTQIQVERQRFAAEAEATIATAVAEMERRLAEQTHEYTHSFEAIRDELAATLLAQTSLETEAARLRESHEELTEENARLRDALEELHQPLAELDQLQPDGTRAIEVDRQALAAETEATIATAIAEMERRLAEQNREYGESYEAVRDELASERAARKSLEAEAAILTEARETLAEKNAGLLNALDEIRQQLAETQVGRTVDFQGVEVERQRMAAEAQATIAVAVAEMERRLADQAREFTESFKAVREELAAALESRQSLERARDEWQRQAAEAAEFQAEQSKKILALEEQLAQVQARADRPVAQERSVRAGMDEVAATEERSDLGRAGNEPSRGLEGATSYLRSIGVLSEGQLDDAPAFAKPVEDGVTERPSAGSGDERAAERRIAASESTGAKATESTSFIDRYSHLFVDDDRASGEERQTSTPQGDESRAAANPVLTGANESSSRAKASSAKDEDEESIEQYMKKLLERVRGDSGPSSTFVPAPAVPTNSVPVGSEADTSAESGPLPDVDVAPATDSSVVREAVRRKSVAAEARTDLGALRALANETTRWAISRSELKKHRRNAVTKVIVSTLAGVTSLWLMLDSPNFKDIQFITACVLLVVAAIWAGETYRTLLQSLRAAAYDGPEDEAEAVEEVDGAAIDLESQGSL